MTCWPSREIWAKRRRTFYIDQRSDVGTALADFVRPDEIDGLEAALHARWRELRPGDEQRRHVNKALWIVRRGELPVCLEDCLGAGDILAPFHARREAAQVEADERKRVELLQAPIDDAAWQAELQRRAKVDGWLNRGEAA